MSAWWLQYYTTLFQYTILYTHIHTYIDIIILHYYITLLQVYYITPLRHILYALSILPHNEYSLRTIFIHYSIISLYTSTVQRYTPYHNICFNALFHFLHFSSLPIYLFISNRHSSIPRCNNLSFINYTFIYAHKNWWKWVKRKINRYSLLFIGHKRLFESRSVGRLWGHVLPPSRESLVEFLAGERNLTSILTSSLLRDLPDQYLYRRNTRNRSSHLPKARPVSSLSEVTRPLFFFLLLFLLLSSNEASGFQGEDTLPVLGELILETQRKERDLKRRRKSKLWDCLLHWMGERMVF